MMIAFMVIIFVGAGVLQLFGSVMYRSAVTMAIVFAVLVGASVVVDLLTKARVAGQSRVLEFEG